MNKKEVSEIRKQFTPDRCTIDRFCGCYVDGEKNKKASFREVFLSLPEEEMFKYFDIFKKSLSGTVGKNLMTMEFPLDAEFNGGTQESLLQLRDSHLDNDDLIEQFYDKIIESYDYGENYLILLIHAVYDVPGKAADSMEMFDASDEVYDHILCSICPVNLDKPALTYDSESNGFRDRIRNWIVEMPMNAFLFPAFTDRSADLHSLLYYSKNADILNSPFIDRLFGCVEPITAKNQKEAFNNLITETLGDTCDVEVVTSIHENIAELIEEHADDPNPVMLDKEELKYIFAKSGADDEAMQEFDEHFEAAAGEDTVLMASNVVAAKKYEIKASEITISVKPEAMDMIETRKIDGRTCIVITVDEHVEINGVMARTLPKFQ